jgi:hypothetical protein
MQKDHAEKLAGKIPKGESQIDLVDGEYVVLFDGYAFKNAFEASAFVEGYRYKEKETLDHT